MASLLLFREVMCGTPTVAPSSMSQFALRDERFPTETQPDDE